MLCKLRLLKAFQRLSTIALAASMSNLAMSSLTVETSLLLFEKDSKSRSKVWKRLTLKERV